MALRRQIIRDLPSNVVNDDAYIALKAISKGFEVKYCEHAKVLIRAPINIADYVKQRRRIIFGHHSLKRLTRHYPRTLETMAFYDPKRVFEILGNEIVERPSQTPKLLTALILEFLINVMALSDLLSSDKQKHVKWSIVNSTKISLENGEQILRRESPISTSVTVRLNSEPNSAKNSLTMQV